MDCLMFQHLLKETGLGVQFMIDGWYVRVSMLMLHFIHMSSCVL
jgi:hypothetical protein